MTQPSEPDARHAEKMRKRKAARDRMMATKTDERGLLIVHTGSGKGKTSAALGMVFRHIGHGLPVGVVQFINRRRATPAKRGSWRAFPISSRSTSWARGSPGRRRTAPATSPPPAPPGSGPRCSSATRSIASCCSTSSISCCATTTCRSTRSLAFLRDEKPADKHVIVTGRNAAPALIEMADLVTEMTLVKHPFRPGVKAQQGIEF